MPTTASRRPAIAYNKFSCMFTIQADSKLSDFEQWKLTNAKLKWKLMWIEGSTYNVTRPLLSSSTSLRTRRNHKGGPRTPQSKENYFCPSQQCESAWQLPVELQRHVSQSNRSLQASIRSKSVKQLLIQETYAAASGGLHLYDTPAKHPFSVYEIMAG